MPPLRGQSNAEKGPVRNIMLGRNGTMGENDKEQDPRSSTTSTRQRSQRRKTRTTNPDSSQERYLGPTRTYNIGRYTTSTAEPRHNMGRTQHRQIQAGKRVSGPLNHPGPDPRVAGIADGPIQVRLLVHQPPASRSAQSSENAVRQAALQNREAQYCVPRTTGFQYRIIDSPAISGVM